MSSGNFMRLIEDIDSHAESTLLRPNHQLDNAVANSVKHELPTIAVQPLQGQFLSVQCSLIGAKSVLEIGTLGGYSTIWFANAGAKVTSIELDPKRREVATENTKGLDVEIILGAALEVLPKLAKDGRVFDLVFIDASWDEQWEYFDWAVKLTRLNGCIYVDNAIRAMLENEELNSKESLLAKVGSDERVQATLVPTLSSRKAPEDRFDGFLFAVVKNK